MKSYLLLAGFLLLLSGMLNAQETPHQMMEMDCETCHQSESWSSIRFDHRQTGFMLEGQHSEQTCRQCHQIRNFSKIDRQCTSCHIDIHRGRLSNWCGACHQPEGWQILDYSRAHANTTFPLLGRHERLDCAACHTSEIEGEFSPLQADCYACHQPQFEGVQSPNHKNAGFSKRCDECHNFYGWSPAEFRQHDIVFPIFSGEHSGEWSRCEDCHNVPKNFSEFTCLNCHKHNQSEMDREHREVAGYAYESHACLSCHPTGTKGED